MYFERSEDESKYPFSFNNSCNNIRDLLPWQKYLLKPHQDMFSVLVKIQKITIQGKPKLPIKFNPLKENKSLCVCNHIDLCIGESNYSSIWKMIFREHNPSATWKVSVFGAGLVRIFPAFSRIQIIRKMQDQNNSEYGHFLALILESYNYELIILTNV